MDRDSVQLHPLAIRVAVGKVQQHSQVVTIRTKDRKVMYPLRVGGK